MSGLFQRALVSGVNQKLIQSGHVSYMSKEAAALATDTVADHVFSPHEVFADGRGVPHEKIAATIDGLLKVSSEIKQRYGDQEDQNLKLAASNDLGTVGAHEVHRLMVKAAEESMGGGSPLGSTLMGGEKGNDQAQSPNAEAQMDNAQRPQGEYNVETGEQADAGRGPVGEEAPVDKGPANSPAGENSVTQASKMGSLQDLLSKIAMGSNYEGGDKGNKPGQAAAVTDEGKMDNTLRPEGYANDGVGSANHPTPATATVGQEQAHPEKPKNSPEGSNSVTKMSHDEMFVELFKKTAEEIHGKLPDGMSDDQKVAAIRHMMVMTPDERGVYIGGLTKSAEEGENPFAGGDDDKGEESDDKEEKKDDDKKEDDEEKEASSGDLLSRIRDIAASA